MANYLTKFLTMLNPVPAVGGLAISDSVVRFVRLGSGSSYETFSLRLPQGIVVDGKVANYPELVTALRELHAQVVTSRTPLHIVLLLPSGSIYTQSFAVPILSDDQLNEAARLNLEMNSPIDFEHAYSGWQRLTPEDSTKPQIEILGAVASAELVDSFLNALGEANFIIAAVEFPALALSRLFGERIKLSAEEPYLVLDVTSDGMVLFIARGGELYFNHFHPWSVIRDEIGGSSIDKSAFESFVAGEVKKVLAFYTSRFGGTIRQAVVLGQTREALAQVLEHRQALQVVVPDLSRFGDLETVWLGPIEAARRGAVARRADRLISLTSASVQVRFEQSETLSFIRAWRKILAVVTVFLLLVVIGVDSYVVRIEQDLIHQLAQAPQVEAVEVSRLQTEAENFNALAAMVASAYSKTDRWSLVLERFIIIAGSEISLRNVSITPTPIQLGGIAVNEASVIAFKARLEAESYVEAVTFSLADLVSNPDGTVGFDLRATVTSFR